MATRPRRRRRPTMVPAAISLAPTAPALPRGKPQGLVRSPSVWRSIESLGGKEATQRQTNPGVLYRGPGAFLGIAPVWP
jgi:hypothetical protein